MINKFLRNLSEPHKIPKKIFKKIRFYFKKKNYNQQHYEDKQNKIFENLNFSRSKGKEKIKVIKDNFNIKTGGMSSEHEILFACISLEKKLNIKNILEIGTFDGSNSHLLSRLFTESEIDTIDLSSNSTEFIQSYNRGSSLNDFIQRRTDNLSKSKKINFKELNSLNLINHRKKYDLIWIDGAHGYPVVSSDILNSLNLINDNGIILCDDIYTNLEFSKYDKMYKSMASYETLKALEEQKIIKFDLIYKRLDSKFNCDENDRQFVAICERIFN